MNRGVRRHEEGFTLLELAFTVAIIGILTAIAFPALKAYRLRAEYASLEATLRYLMDGIETYYILNDKFYPADLVGSITVNQGQAMSIPELKYNFPAGHKHRFQLTTINIDPDDPSKRFAFFPYKWNYALLYVYADFDMNGNGTNDLYVLTMEIQNNAPVTGNYRRIQQSW